MKNVFFILCVSLLLCNGCKFFKNSSSRTVDTITADTVQSDQGTVDSAAYYTGITEVKSPSEPSVSHSNASKGTYYMIVGCFTVQNNAEKYVEKLRGMGYDPQIISGRDNFQMVSARSYNNYKESIGELDKFRNEVTPSAWVYKKK